MGGIVESAYARVPQWLGVHVPRRINTDADLLSHPAKASAVELAASSGQLAVHRCEVGPDHRCWSTLRALIVDSMGRADEEGSDGVSDGDSGGGGEETDSGSDD